LDIDKNIFYQNFSKEFLDNVHNNKVKAIELSENKEINKRFYYNLSNYAGRTEDAQFVNFLDLYPTNVIILDYVLKNIDKFRSKTWLDFGCGLGMLMVYLNSLGIDCYGYDNWSFFLNKDDSINFLKNYNNLENKLVSIDEVYEKSNIWFSTSSSGIWNELDFSKFNNLKYIFDDSMYKAKNEIEKLGFNVILNNKLIRILKRK